MSRGSMCGVGRGETSTRGAGRRFGGEVGGEGGTTGASRRARTVNAEKRRSDAEASLSFALHTPHEELDAASAQLDAINSERKDGAARIEGMEHRAEDLRREMVRTARADVADRAAKFREWEVRYWEREDRDAWSQQLLQGPRM